MLPDRALPILFKTIAPNTRQARCDQNLGRSLEGTEHKNDTAIVPWMHDGLDSTAGEIQIDDSHRLFSRLYG